MSPRWLLYGANGYTGKSIAEKAKLRGLSPILAGRREEPIQALADRLGFPYRIFDLSDQAQTDQGLEGVTAVLHCAGPFSKTSGSMVDACLRRKVHYLDITGEISVFESIRARSKEGVAAGVTLIPGVGFDVVPSDCLAAILAESLPGATVLEIAFASAGGLSPGTLKTMIEHLDKGGAVRRGGKIVSSRPAEFSKRVRFSDKVRSVVSLPWGDIATAYYSTKIPNITIYIAGSPIAARIFSAASQFIKMNFVKSGIQKLVEKRVEGPSAYHREKGSVKLWGRVTDPSGNYREAWLDTPEGYSLTAEAALESIERVMSREIKVGFLTPSQAFGPSYILELTGTKLTMLPC